jgi:PBSX family phage terminase large subunit
MAFSPKQVQSFCEATKRLNIWVGAVSSGKTYSSIHKLIDLLRNGPNGACMIIGVSRDSIQRNVLIDLYRILGFPTPSSKSTESKLYGKHIYFIGANDESSVRRIQGATLASAYVDEATCIPAAFWRMLLSRLRIKDAQLLATCNPDGPMHWLKKEYIDRANELDLIHWNFTLDDNPSLDPKYVDSLRKEYTGMWYKRYILGEWAVAHGLIYDSFDHLNIFSDRLTAPNYYTIGLDYGTTNATAAVLLAITPNQWPQIRVEEEYYYDSAKKGRSQTDSELADDIKEFIGYKSINAIYIDPAAASLKAELRRKDLPVIDAKNDVLQGIKVTSKFIAQKNLVIHRGCQVLLDHIQSYAWDPKAADRGEDKPIKVRDHILDALRYGILSSFPSGELSNPDEQLTADQLRRKIYGDNDYLNIGMGSGGYY